MRIGFRHPDTALLLFLIMVFSIVGWIKNVIKLSDCDFQSPYKAEIIHAAGLIPPVGMITGWLNLGK